MLFLRCGSRGLITVVVVLVSATHVARSATPWAARRCRRCRDLRTGRVTVACRRRGRRGTEILASGIPRPQSLRALCVRTCAVLASRGFLSGGARGGGPSSGSGGASLRSFNSTTSNSEALPPCKNEGLVPPVLRASRADGSLRFGAALEESAAACAAATAAAVASFAAAPASASSSSSAPLSSSCDKARITQANAHHHEAHTARSLP